jgi:hypothetical protein
MNARFNSQAVATRGSIMPPKENLKDLKPAEWLLELGSGAKLLARRGVDVKQIAVSAQVGEELCLLSLAFFLSPNDLRLRALVEDWDLGQIATGIAEAAKRVAETIAPSTAG